VTATARGQEAVACLLDAVAEAERVTGLDDLRDDRGMMLVLEPDGQQIGLVPGRSRSSPTTAGASAARPTVKRSPARIRYCGTSVPG
jgi:hypothetical protein